MSQQKRHIKSQYNLTYEGPYATIKQPTNATFISKETMEINEEKNCLQQESKIVYDESRLVKDKETKG